MITVFTPTYNRKNRIPLLYNSLLKQNFKNFEWLIVDDGSSDGTNKYVRKIIKENKINIRYYYKENGGKHTAFNKGIKLAKGEVFICVDSDDYLTKDALHTINLYYNKYLQSKKKLAGFVFLKGYNENESVTKKYPQNETLNNYNSYIINGNIKGDKAEVFLTNVLKKYSFPKFENEKFLAEGFLWSKIGRNYDYVFINKIIYVCEYLQEGLTKSGKKLRINNPIGGIAHAIEYLDSEHYCLKVRIKNAMLYNIYMNFCKDKYGKIPLNLKKNYIIVKFLKLPSYMIYKYWKKKYL